MRLFEKLRIRRQVRQLKRALSSDGLATTERELRVVDLFGTPIFIMVTPEDPREKLLNMVWFELQCAKDKTPRDEAAIADLEALVAELQSRRTP